MDSIVVVGITIHAGLLAWIIGFGAQVVWAIGIFVDRILMRNIKVRMYEKYGEVQSSTGTLVLVSSFFNIIVVAIIFAIIVHNNDYTEAVATVSMSHEDILKSIGSGFLEMLWLIPYFYAMDQSDETVAPPLLQTVPIFGFVLGFYLFGEMPTGIEIIGCLAILGGALIINLNILKQRIRLGIVSIGTSPVVLMVLAAFLVSLSKVLFKDAVDHNYWGASFWSSIGSVLFGFVTLISVRKYRREFGAFLKARCYGIYLANLTNEGVDIFAIYLFNAAIMFAPSLSVVQSTIAYQPVLLLILTYIFARNGSLEHQFILKNMDLKTKVLGIGIILIAGIVVNS